MLSVFSLSPYVTLLTSAIATGTWPWLPAAAAFAIVGQQSVLWRFYGVTGNRPAWATSYALGAALCLGMTLNAMRRLVGTTTTWRGTTYTGGARTTSESTTVH